MPMPNKIPPPDWPAVFSASRDYANWRSIGTNETNQEAMDQMYDDTQVDPAVAARLKDLGRKVNVLALAEDWCPDVVRHVPVLEKMADLAPNLEVKYTTRDDNHDVLVRFLTNGTESVPKFVFFNEDFAQCAMWGPMPHDCRELIQRGRACNDLKAARVKVFHLYQADTTREIVVNELMHCIDIASAIEP